MAQNKGLLPVPDWHRRGGLALDSGDGSAQCELGSVPVGLSVPAIASGTVRAWHGPASESCEAQCSGEGRIGVW